MTIIYRQEEAYQKMSRLQRLQGDFALKVEVEVDSEKDADEAIAAGADIIMLDNFSGDRLKIAANSIKQMWADKKSFLLECSGGLTSDNVGTYINNGEFHRL